VAEEWQVGSVRDHLSDQASGHEQADDGDAERSWLVWHVRLNFEHDQIITPHGVRVKNFMNAFRIFAVRKGLTLQPGCSMLSSHYDPCRRHHWTYAPLRRFHRR
jgi:hypothetical protein